MSGIQQYTSFVLRKVYHLFKVCMRTTTVVSSEHPGTPGTAILSSGTKESALAEFCHRLKNAEEVLWSATTSAVEMSKSSYQSE